MRLTKDEYYLNIALEVSKRGTCIRRNYGAVIVNGDEIVSTGYTGAPRGASNCIETGKCIRDEMKIPSGERYDICKSVHAEQNAIISAGRSRCIGGTIYVIGLDVALQEVMNTRPCYMCLKFILNAGIQKVVSRGWQLIDLHILSILNDEWNSIL